ncbi:unnamed protein product [Brachionus calyciflorus]|uniref:Uncharacterized protein n=1 Tax=Brachionus calyciflorus TaxID=104777 RepID=A0A814NP33_9BILA|nr:unnamed protein product [Brachionus calyciflorus]
MVSGECVSAFQGHDDLINYVTEMSNDNLVNCSDDYTLKIWDINSLKCIVTLKGHNHYVQYAIVNGDTQLLNDTK